MANDRISQLPVETLVSPTSGKARTSQEAVETLLSPTSGKARTSQAVVETLVSPTSGKARTSQAVVEVLLQNLHGGTFTADAIVVRTPSGSFTADAVLTTVGFTANAVIKKTQTGSLSEDAVIQRNQTGSFTANAVRLVGRTGSFTANATVLKTYSFTFTANAVIASGVTTVAGSFIASATGQKTQASSFPASAVIQKTQPSSATANAVLLRTQTGSFTANADTQKTQLNSLIASAVLKKTLTGSSTADAVVASVGSVTGSFTANAVLLRVQTSPLNADAIVKKTALSSAIASAVLASTQVSSFTANAVRARQQTGGLTASAVRIVVQAGSLSADAVLKLVRPGSFTADAVRSILGSGTFTANAVVLKRLFQDTFTRTVASGLGGPWYWHPSDSYSGNSNQTWVSVNGTAAVIQSDVAGEPRYDSYVGFPLATTGDLYFDFYVPATFSSSFPTYGLLLDAWNYYGVYVSAQGSADWTLNEGPSFTYTFTPIASTWYRVHARYTTGAFFANVYKQTDPEPAGWQYDHPFASVLGVDYNPPFLDFYYSPFGPTAGSVDNVEVWSSQSTWKGYGDFQLDAVILRPAFTADAIRRASRTGTFTANAVIEPRKFLAASIIKKTITGSFTANAAIGHLRSFAVYATIKGARTGSFTAAANIGVRYRTFTADALIYIGSTGGGTGGGGTGTTSGGGTGSTVGGGGGSTIPDITVNITYDGTDITSDVEIATAEFISMTNGNAGTCRIRVRDDGHTHSFISGKEITMSISGRKVWGGYLLQAKRTYPFPVENTQNVATSLRYWDLSGADYNFLFERRIIYSAANPTTKHEWNFRAGTYDDTIIKAMMNGYIPGIAGDGISQAGIKRVDIAVLDVPNYTTGVDATGHRRVGGLLASAGDTWRGLMDQISRSTGAVYYIDPDKVLNYADVDTVDSAYSLSDAPSTQLQVGYQKFTLMENGAGLVNDYLLWGAALGLKNMVFAHVQDAASIASHGRWQAGNFNSALFHQNVTNLSANSVVYGTPQNKRGHKDDAISFSCTVFLPVFRAGQKVHVYNNIYGWDDVIPIRKMRTTFVSPHQAVFELDLSHYIDEPWSAFEQNWPKLQLPKVPPPPKLPPTVQSSVGGCDDLCGTTDGFARPNQSGWGLSDFGPSWDTSSILSGTPTPVRDIVDGRGRLSIAGGGPGLSIGYLASASLSPGLYLSTVRFDVRFTSWQDAATSNTELTFSALHSGFALTVRNRRVGSGAVSRQLVLAHFATGLETAITFDPALSTTYHVLWEVSGTQRRAKFYTGTEPVGWDITQTSTRSFVGVPFFQFELSGMEDTGGLSGVVVPPLEVYVDALQLWEGSTQLDRCSAVQFDNFNGRTVAYDWGTSASGIQWFPLGPGTYSKKAVESGYAKIEQLESATAGGQTQMYTESQPEAWSGDYSMRTRFQVNVYSATTDGSASMYTEAAGGNFGWGMRVDSSGVGSVQIFSNAGSPSTSYGFTVGAWYNVRHEIASGVQRFKIWADPGTEPTGWLLQQSGVVNRATTRFVVLHQRNNIAFVSQHFNWAVWYDYIEFAYAGKPCYSLCDVVQLDDFNRTTTSPNWGTSNTGYAWTDVFGAPTFTTFVSGGEVLADISATSGVAKHVTGAGPWATASGFVMTTRFRVLDIVGGSSGSIELSFAVESANFGTVGVRVANNGDGQVYVLDATSATTLRTSGWTTSDYMLKWERRLGGVSRVKVWLASGAEPGGWDAEATAATDVPTGFVVDLESHTIIEPGRIRINYIDFVQCVDVLPATPSSSPSGYVCETATTSNYRDYFLASAFQAGSSEVWVSGLRYINGPGASNYTEDPVAGTILFGATLATTAVVRVCYMANGIYGPR